MKENQFLNVNKKYVCCLLAGILNILFYILHNRYEYIFNNHKYIFKSIIVSIIVFSIIWITKLLKKYLTRKNQSIFLKKNDSKSRDALLSLINDVAILINIYYFNCYIIAKFAFLKRNQIFMDINIIAFVILITTSIIINTLNFMNIKKKTIIIIIGVVYIIGIFDLNEIYFGTAFSILLTSLASLDNLKNMGAYLRKRGENSEFTQYVNSLIEESLSEDELNGKIELLKILITSILLCFITIIKITEMDIKDCSNLVDIILFYIKSKDMNFKIDKFTKILYTGTIRIIMGFILFIFFYSFRKIRFFINTLLLSKNKDIDLWDKGIINNFEVGTYKGLKQIHKYLYRDIYEFAGKTRDVNLAKGNLRFTNILYLENNLAIIEKMPEGSFDEIIEKYVEMNVAHPFREGNGRATRIWLDLMLKKNLNVCVDWAMVDRADYLSAMERSPVNSLEIKHLLKNALTDRVDDRGVYLRGIQQSYVYEDLDRYDIEDIEE